MKNNFTKIILPTVLVMLCSFAFGYLNAQDGPCGPGVGTVLFSEDFEGEADGAVSGTDASGIPWTATCPGCVGGDFFEVDSNSGNAQGCNGTQGLRGNDTNGPGTFNVPGLDISACEVVYFAFDYCSTGYTGTGNLECVDECSGCSGVPSEGVTNGGCNNCWDFLFGELDWGSGNSQQILLGSDCAAPESGSTGSAICGTLDADGVPIPPADLMSVDINIVMAMWAGTENMVIDNVTLICYSAADVAACADPAVAEACPCDATITDLAVASESCGGEMDGSISITATSVNPLEFSIDGGLSFQPTGSYTDLAPGVYDIIVQVVGEPGCNTTAMATVAAGVVVNPPTVDMDMEFCQNAVNTIPLTASCPEAVTLGGPITTLTMEEAWVNVGADDVLFTTECNTDGSIAAVFGLPQPNGATQTDHEIQLPISLPYSPGGYQFCFDYTEDGCAGGSTGPEGNEPITFEVLDAAGAVLGSVSRVLDASDQGAPVCLDIIMTNPDPVLCMSENFTISISASTCIGGGCGDADRYGIDNITIESIDGDTDPGICWFAEDAANPGNPDLTTIIFTAADPTAMIASGPNNDGVADIVDGLPFDPIATGDLDPNIPGVYNFYAICKTCECESMVAPVAITILEAAVPFAYGDVCSIDQATLAPDVAQTLSGTYTIDPAGSTTIDPATGELDFTAVACTDGLITYTITFTPDAPNDGDGCSQEATINVTAPACPPVCTGPMDICAGNPGGSELAFTATCDPCPDIPQLQDCAVCGELDLDGNQIGDENMVTTQSGCTVTFSSAPGPTDSFSAGAVFDPPGGGLPSEGGTPFATADVPLDNTLPPCTVYEIVVTSIDWTVTPMGGTWSSEQGFAVTGPDGSTIVEYVSCGAFNTACPGQIPGSTGNGNPVSGTETGPFTFTTVLTSAASASFGLFGETDFAAGGIDLTINYTVTYTQIPSVSGQVPATALPGPAATITWFDAPGGTVQGTGSPFIPISGTSTAEEGVFDINVPGTYTFYSQCDCGGCPSDLSACDITINENPTCTTTVTDVICNGEATGTATATGMGGVMPYSFVWDAAAANQTTATATALAAGTYMVTITDANLCSSVCEATVAEPPALTCMAMEDTPVVCFGEANGIATVTPDGGNGGYTFEWDNGEMTATAMALNAGVHVVTVTDMLDCTTTCEVTITEPPLLTCTAVEDTPVVCNGESNGIATVTPVGGNGGYTFEWDNGEMTATAMALDVGVHVVTVTDMLDCTTICEVTITEPPLLTCTAVEDTPVVCNGEANGIATVTPVGGNGGYTFAWDNGEMTATAVALDVGVHVVTVTDMLGCTTTCEVTITEPPLLSCTAVEDTPVVCNGEANGIATVTPVGGNGGYTFAWDNGEMTATAIALDAGVHVVTVTDMLGCTATCEVTITEPPLLTCSAIQDVQVVCFGESNGIATVTPVGGNGGNTFLWDNGETTSTATALNAGVHTVVVTDMLGCVTQCDVTITEPPLLTCAAVQDVQVVCFGESNGIATVTPEGGNGGNTFLWDNGETTATALALNAGVHTVVVTDMLGCVTQCDVTITEPDLLVCTAVEDVPVVCFGESNGISTVTPTGGNGGNTYLWDNGETTATALALNAGLHNVTVTDMFGCVTSCSVTITEPDLLTCTAVEDTPVRCNGEANGISTVTPVGGNGGYTYVWDNGERTQTATGLTAGLHTVIVTDELGCVTSCDVTITEPDVLTCAAVEDTPVRCNGESNGVGSVTAEGGNGGYAYVWTSGETSATATMLAAGVNRVTVTDALGCIATCEVIITEPDPLICEVVQTMATCAGESDGAATASAVGGNGGYTYLWDTGATTATETGLAKGVYNVTVTDALGCTTTCQAIINDIPNPSVDFDGVTDETCPGAMDGTITVGAFSGIPPYTINLYDGDLATGSIIQTITGTNPTVFSSLPAGTYSVEIIGTTTQGNECDAILEGIEVEMANPITVDLVITDEVCANESDGTVTINATSAEVLEYSLDGGPFGSNNVYTGLSAGSHFITVRFANSQECQFTETFDIAEGIQVNAPDPVMEGSACMGAETGALSATCEVGCDAVWYAEQFGGAPLFAGDEFDPIAIGLINGDNIGTYTYWVDCECMDCGTSERTPLMLVVHPNPTPPTIIGDNSVCPDEEVAYTVDPVDAASTYVWTAIGGTVTATTGAQATITWDGGIENGSVSVTQTDANGCTATSVLDVTIEVDETIACKTTSLVSLDDNCSATVTAGSLVQSAPYDESSYEVVDIVDNATGEALEVNMDGSISITEKGEYTVQVQHICSGNSCWGILIANDTQIPTIICPPTKEVFCDGDLKPVWPDDYPQVDDNCCVDADVIESYSFEDFNTIPAGTDFVGFTGDFRPSNWTEVITGGDGSIEFSADGSTLTITGDGESGVGGNQTNAAYTFTSDGTISFDWDFQNNDVVAQGFDTGVVVIDADGNQTDVVPAISVTGDGTVASFSVSAGEILIIATVSADGLDGPGVFTITNFTFNSTLEITLDPDDECAGGVYRVWTVTDCCGNVSESCGQIVRRVRPELADITFPDDIELECVDGFPGTDPIDLDGILGNSDTDGDVDIYDEDYPALPMGDDHIDIDAKECKFIVSFTDIEIQGNGLCDGSKKILRTWTVFDWCSGENRIEDQIISINDNAAPVVTCESIVTVSTDGFNCEGPFTIPAAEVTDACSDNPTYSITLEDGSSASVGDVITVVGSTTITYLAVDDCGNGSDECTTTIIVSDEIAPVAICDQNTVVSLTNDGVGQMCAETVDDGSYDNCSDDLIILVKRMDSPNNIPFTDCVEFDCEDVGNNVQVRFRVSDGLGFGECMVNVDVQDKIGPVITCPPNKNLNCGADLEPNEVSPNDIDGFPAFYNGEMIGYYPAFDNCNNIEVTIEDSGELDLCGEGTILRTWTAHDTNGGNSTSCVQVITIQKTAIATFTGTDVPGDDDDILWPADVDLDCTEFQNDSAVTDPANSGEPELIGEEDDCANLLIGYDDQVLNNDPTACLKILRTWTVIDHCQYDPDNGIFEGIWLHTQLIKIDDETDPVFDNCDDEIATIDGIDGCEGEVTVTRTAADACATDLDYTWTVVTDNGDTFSGEGSTFTETLTVGTHIVTWTATDNCENVETCTHELKVNDGKQPSPVCVVLYTALMPSVGSVPVWASDFESGSSFDNCTAYEDLNFYVLPVDAPIPPQGTDISDLPTSITFDCSQLGFQSVHMIVEDEGGNFDFCLTQVFVSDTQCVCPDNPCDDPMLQIRGVVETEDEEKVDDVTMDVSGLNNNALTTGDDGLFNFFNIPMGTSTVVTPEKDINYLNGVTTFDLVLISQHILGVQELDSPYKIIAADANKSNTVTTLDLVKIQRLILNIDQDLSPNTSWRFVDMDYTFPQMDNPFAETFPEIISLSNLTADEMYADFIGVKIGDVNGSAVPNGLLGSQTRSMNGTLDFEMQEQLMSAGKEYEVQVSSSNFNQMLGYQYTIQVEGAEILEVIPGAITSEENFGTTAIDKGIITTSWHSASSVNMSDEVLYTLRLRATANTSVSEALSVSSQMTKAESYTAEGDLKDIAFNFTNGTTVTSTAFELYQNRPNPFKEATVIGYTLPQADKATITIMDISGKVLKLIEQDAVHGYNEVAIDKSSLQGAGVLYYRLETANNTATKKMTLIK